MNQSANGFQLVRGTKSKELRNRDRKIRPTMVVPFTAQNRTLTWMYEVVRELHKNAAAVRAFGLWAAAWWPATSKGG